MLKQHRSELGSWDAQGWRLGLGIFSADKPLGVATLRARDFPVAREVTTSSWIGLPHHGRGLGTEARTGVLAFAFEHLGAETAVTEVFRDNHASQGVSRKLGYEHDGIRQACDFARRTCRLVLAVGRACAPRVVGGWMPKECQP